MNPYGPGRLNAPPGNQPVTAFLFHLNHFGLRLFTLGKIDGEDSVLEFRLDAVCIHERGKGERSLEGAVTAFGTVKILLGTVFAFSLFTTDRENVVGN